MENKIKRLKSGQIFEIELGSETVSYARLMEPPLCAFYGKQYSKSEKPSINEIVLNPIAFKIWVMRYALTEDWKNVGHLPLEAKLTETVKFFKQDILNKEISIYYEVGNEYFEEPATLEEVEGLELAAVWESESIIERLNDYFSGNLEKWVDKPVS